MEDRLLRDPAKLQQLVEDPATLEWRSATGATPLIAAVKAGAPLAALEILLDAGADVTAARFNGETALAAAADRGAAAVVRRLLQHPDAPTGARMAHPELGGGVTALHVAVFRAGALAGGAEAAAVLEALACDSRVDVNQPGLLDWLQRHGLLCTALPALLRGGLRAPPDLLLVALRQSGGRLSPAVEALLAAGGDWRVADDDGLTPLHLAATRDCAVALLAQKQLLVIMPSARGVSPLQAAIRERRFAVAAAIASDERCQGQLVPLLPLISRLPETLELFGAVLRRGLGDLAELDAFAVGRTIPFGGLPLLLNAGFSPLDDRLPNTHRALGEVWGHPCSRALSSDEDKALVRRVRGNKKKKRDLAVARLAQRRRWALAELARALSLCARGRAATGHPQLGWLAAAPARIQRLVLELLPPAKGGLERAVRRNRLDRSGGGRDLQRTACPAHPRAAGRR